MSKQEVKQAVAAGVLNNEYGLHADGNCARATGAAEERDNGFGMAVKSHPDLIIASGRRDPFLSACREL